MDTINSQNLTHFDAYYHRFMNVGDYKWGITVKQDYKIHVQQAPGGYVGKQTVIHLEFVNGSYTVTDAGKEITINTTDFVQWHNDTPDTSVPPYSIVGDNGKSGAAKDAFNSRSLGAEDAFSHFVVSPGDYQYTVTGGGSPQYGTFTALDKSAGAGPVLVTLEDGKAPNPNPIKRTDGNPVYAGDTILWDVHTGKNLVIKT